MDKFSKDKTDRLIAAADQLLALQSGTSTEVLSPEQIVLMLSQGSVELSAFSRAELLEAYSFLVRLGFAKRRA